MWKDNSDAFSVEGLRRYGPNVISFILVSGLKRWYLIGAYYPPSERGTDTTTLHWIQEAELRVPSLPQVLLGDLNVDLSTNAISNPFLGAVAATVAELGVLDLLDHYRQRRAFRHRTTWRQWRQGHRLSSRCDYILVSNPGEWKSCRIAEPRGIASDHYMVVAELCLTPSQRHLRYLRGRRWCPLLRRHNSAMDRSFERILAAAEASPAKELPPWRDWISPESWRLFDLRAQRHRASSFAVGERRALNRVIRRSIQWDRRSRCTRVGAAMETCLAGGDLQGAWRHLKGWYQHTKKTHTADRAMKPTHLDLAAVRSKYAELYAPYSPPGDPIPVVVDPFDISDELPTADEISAAVLKAGSLRLRRRRHHGPIVGIDSCASLRRRSVRDTSHQRCATVFSSSCPSEKRANIAVSAFWRWRGKLSQK